MRLSAPIRLLERDFKVCYVTALCYAQVCSSLTICCDTGHLDHTLKNDFQEGKISVFTETQIGQCSHFDLGDDTNGDNIKMVLEHSGNISRGP